MAGERVAFTEEVRPGQYLKVIASGDVDDFLLEALEDFVKRQRKLRDLLKRPAGQAQKPEWADQTFRSGNHVPADGTYAVHHQGHDGPGFKEYSKGQRFTSCEECRGDGVRYKFEG